MDEDTRVYYSAPSSNLIEFARASMRNVLTGEAGEFTCSVPFSNSTKEAEEDPRAAGSMLLAGDVAVGESLVCQGTYVLTSDDIDALETTSVASVWASDIFNKEVTDSSTATTPLDQVRPPGPGQNATATVFEEQESFVP